MHGTMAFSITGVTVELVFFIRYSWDVSWDAHNPHTPHSHHTRLCTHEKKKLGRIASGAQETRSTTEHARVCTLKILKNFPKKCDE
jgi:hypothetical protein